MSEIEMNTVLLLGIAAFNCVTAIVGYFSHKAMKELQKDVRTVEKATNSMKDALVASTDKAARAEGHAQGLTQGREERRPKV